MWCVCDADAEFSLNAGPLSSRREPIGRTGLVQGPGDLVVASLTSGRFVRRVFGIAPTRACGGERGSGWGGSGVLDGRCGGGFRANGSSFFASRARAVEPLVALGGGFWGLLGCCLAWHGVCCCRCCCCWMDRVGTPQETGPFRAGGIQLGPFLSGLRVGLCGMQPSMLDSVPLQGARLL